MGKIMDEGRNRIEEAFERVQPASRKEEKQKTGNSGVFN
jgi:hypothetical protein